MIPPAHNWSGVCFFTRTFHSYILWYMYLFPPDKDRLSWASASDWRTRMWRNLLLEKLKTPAGFTIAVVLGLGIAWLIGRSTPQEALIFLLALIAVPVSVISFLFPSRGLMALIGIGFVVGVAKRIEPGFPFGVTIDAMALILSVGVFYRISIHRQWEFLRHPVAWMVMFWIAYCGLEYLNPWSRAELGWLYAFRSVAGWWGFLLIALFAIRRHRQMISLHRIWIVASLLASLYGIYQWWAGPSEAEMQWILSSPELYELIYINGSFRSFSIFGSPGTLGILSSLNVAFVLILAFRKGGSAERKLLGSVLAIIFFLSLLASGSRTGMFLLPIGLFTYALISLRKSALILSGVLLTSWAAIQIIPASGPVMERIKLFSNPTNSIGFQLRAQNQTWVQPFIQEHPIGSGLGTTGELGKRFAPDIWLSQFPPDSAYVRFALETGWVGLLIFMGLLFVILQTGIRALFRTRSPREKQTIQAYLVFCLMVIAGSTLQQLYTQLPIGLMFILFSASLVTLSRQKKKNGRTES